MRYPLWTLACTVLPGIAAAHTGDHGTMSFSAGFLHPLTGIDHLLAMLGFGVIAQRAKGALKWLLPACCLVAVSFGAMLAFASVQLLLVEVMITLSVLLTGIAVIARVQVPTHLAAALTALFALCHGYAHGAEMPATLSSVTYSAGFLVGTTLLLTVGFVASSMRSTPSVKQPTK